MRRHVPGNMRRLARDMRRNPTDAEAALWEIVRGRRLEGLRFRRQHPIAGYIVDFVCLDARLVIEVDGDQHSECMADVIRDARLGQLGYRVLRFWNHEVLENGEGVARDILFFAGLNDDPD